MKNEACFNLELKRKDQVAGKAEEMGTQSGLSSHLYFGIQTFIFLLVLQCSPVTEVNIPTHSDLIGLLDQVFKVNRSRHGRGGTMSLVRHRLQIGMVQKYR